MKKMFFLISFLCVTGIYSATAAKIFGIEVKVVKGTKEWNADRTAIECVGKGFCEITIKATLGGPEPQLLGTLGWIDGSSFGFSVPASILRDSKWSDTFVNGFVTIQKDVLISPDISSQIKNCPNTIKAGKYRYSVDGGNVYVYFQ